jgi:hypothetical protein
MVHRHHSSLQQSHRYSQQGINPTLTLVANYLLCIESFALDGDFKLRKIRTSSSKAV